MKLRNKLTLITTAAALAFVGTGFAAWTFVDPVDTGHDDAANAVACAVELNKDFKLKMNGNDITNLYLIFDAPAHDVNAHVIGGNGIYWSTTNDSTAYVNKIEGEVLSIEGTMKYDKKDVDDLAKVTVTFADNGSALADTDYVDFGTAVIPDAKEYDIPAASNAAIAVASDKFALPTVEYKDAIKNVTSISDLAAITSGVSVSLKYQVYISAQQPKA